MAGSELYMEYEKFLNQLGSEQARAPFLSFFEAVKAADNAMSELSRRDRYGRIPLLTQAHRQRLLELHLALGRSAEALIANGQIPENQKDAVKKIAALGANNFRHLQAYDPAKPQSLPRLLEQARTLTLDLRNAVLDDTLAGGQSTRQPLTFLDDKGREIIGVFTPKKVTDIWDRINRNLNGGVDKGGLSSLSQAVFRDFMQRLESPEAARYLHLPEDADRRARLEAMYTDLLGKNRNRKEDAVADLVSALFISRQPSWTPETVKARMNPNDIARFLLTVDEYGTEIINNSQLAKIHDGARMDTRNAAMSAVAELLGVPKLLAKSVPMRVINPDGTPVEGTFMMESKGVDVKNIRPEDSYYGENALRELDGTAMKSIADLQVLDYICGNVDRHHANVTYQFIDGKLHSIQGFDNETAFGSLVPKFGDWMGHLGMPEDMVAVSESMEKQLQKITPEMLKFSLRGFDLTEEELDAACQRMQQVKDAIQKSRDYDRQKAEERKQNPQAPQEEPPKDHLKILKDEEFRKLDWEETKRSYEFKRYRKGLLQKQTTQGNFFTKAFLAVKGIKSFYRTQHKEGRYYTPLRSEVPIGMENRAIPTNVPAHLKQMEDLEEALRQATDGSRTSRPFENMHDAVKRCVQFYRDLNHRITSAKRDLASGLTEAQKAEGITKEDLAMDAVVTMADLSELQELQRDIRDCAQDYLGTKNLEKKYKPYTAHRIDLASQIQEIADKAAKVSDKELSTAIRNEREVVEDVNRAYGDALEAKDKEPAPAVSLS